MPDPRPGEGRDAFIERCMADAEARRDFPDDRQRFAFCQSQYDNGSSGMSASDVATGTEVKRFRYPFELKDFDRDARTFSGFASTWERDLQDDVIQRGAFRKTLAEWRKNGAIIPLLDSHDTWSIRSALGRLEQAQEKEAGLWTKWHVVQGADGDEALNRIEDEIVDGLSIGYRAVKWELQEDDTARWGELRILKEIALAEVSLVLFPANPGARLDPVKMIAEMPWTEDQRRELVKKLQPDGGDRKKPQEPEPDRDVGDRVADQMRVDRLRLLRITPTLRRRTRR